MVKPDEGVDGAGADRLVGYFGYGSLVNRHTLRTLYVATRRARLSGWRRHWQGRGVEIAGDVGEIALLSVHRHPAAVISGMLVVDRAAHLPEIDLRERHYDRVTLAAGELALHEAAPAGGQSPGQCHVYVARPELKCGREPRLLQSYLDAVMAGFLAEYGEEGVREFVATTAGFDREAILDRHAPLYPRAVELPPATAKRFDALLVDAGVRFG